MKYRLASVLGLCTFLAGLALAPAALSQSQSDQTISPSKYVYISNNIVRPEQAHAFYKAEEGIVQAMYAANAPVGYLGAVPITGGTDVLFFEPFDSFADLQKNHDTNHANPSLESAFQAAGSAEASLLTDTFGSIYMYRKSLSLRPDIPMQERFLDITLFHVRTGHAKDFERLTRMYKKAAEGIPAYHWITLEKMYGRNSGDTFIIIESLNSLGDEDQMIMDNKQLMENFGKDQIPMLRKLAASTIKSSADNLYAINPRISYAPHWAVADPAFWGKGKQ